jgi:large subunit ribosomal protein L32e
MPETKSMEKGEEDTKKQQGTNKKDDRQKIVREGKRQTEKATKEQTKKPEKQPKEKKPVEESKIEEETKEDAKKKVEKKRKPKVVEKKKKIIPSETAKKLREILKRLKERASKPPFRGRFGKSSIRRKSKDKWNRWRKPRGIDVSFTKAKGKVPSTGYGRPAELRHVHPSGYREVLIHNVEELAALESKKDTLAARIASTVGKKKRDAIIKKANELGIKILN